MMRLIHYYHFVKFFFEKGTNILKRNNNKTFNSFSGLGYTKHTTDDFTLQPEESFNSDSSDKNIYFSKLYQDDLNTISCRVSYEKDKGKKTLTLYFKNIGEGVLHSKNSNYNFLVFDDFNTQHRENYYKLSETVFDTAKFLIFSLDVAMSNPNVESMKIIGHISPDPYHAMYIHPTKYTKFYDAFKDLPRRGQRQQRQQPQQPQQPQEGEEPLKMSNKNAEELINRPIHEFVYNDGEVMFNHTFPFFCFECVRLGTQIKSFEFSECDLEYLNSYQFVENPIPDNNDLYQTEDRRVTFAPSPPMLQNPFWNPRLNLVTRETTQNRREFVIPKHYLKNNVTSYLYYIIPALRLKYAIANNSSLEELILCNNRTSTIVFDEIISAFKKRSSLKLVFGMNFINKFPTIPNFCTSLELLYPLTFNKECFIENRRRIDIAEDKKWVHPKSRVIYEGNPYIVMEIISQYRAVNGELLNNPDPDCKLLHLRTYEGFVDKNPEVMDFYRILGATRNSSLVTAKMSSLRPEWDYGQEIIEGSTMSAYTPHELERSPFSFKDTTLERHENKMTNLPPTLIDFKMRGFELNVFHFFKSLNTVTNRCTKLNAIDISDNIFAFEYIEGIDFDIKTKSKKKEKKADSSQSYHPELLVGEAEEDETEEDPQEDEEEDEEQEEQEEEKDFRICFKKDRNVQINTHMQPKKETTAGTSKVTGKRPAGPGRPGDDTSDENEIKKFISKIKSDVQNFTKNCFAKSSGNYVPFIKLDNITSKRMNSIFVLPKEDYEVIKNEELEKEKMKQKSRSLQAEYVRDPDTLEWTRTGRFVNRDASGDEGGGEGGDNTHLPSGKQETEAIMESVIEFAKLKDKAMRTYFPTTKMAQSNWYSFNNFTPLTELLRCELIKGLNSDDTTSIQGLSLTKSLSHGRNPLNLSSVREFLNLIRRGIQKGGVLGVGNPNYFNYENHEKVLMTAWKERNRTIDNAMWTKDGNFGEISPHAIWATIPSLKLRALLPFQKNVDINLDKIEPIWTLGRALFNNKENRFSLKTIHEYMSFRASFASIEYCKSLSQSDNAILSRNLYLDSTASTVFPFTEERPKNVYFNDSILSYPETKLYRMLNYLGNSVEAITHQRTSPHPMDYDDRHAMLIGYFNPNEKYKNTYARYLFEMNFMLINTCTTFNWEHLSSHKNVNFTVYDEFTFGKMTKSKLEEIQFIRTLIWTAALCLSSNTNINTLTVSLNLTDFRERIEEQICDLICSSKTLKKVIIDWYSFSIDNLCKIATSKNKEFVFKNMFVASSFIERHDAKRVEDTFEQPDQKYYSRKIKSKTEIMASFLQSLDESSTVIVQSKRNDLLSNLDRPIGIGHEYDFQLNFLLHRSKVVMSNDGLEVEFYSLVKAVFHEIDKLLYSKAGDDAQTKALKCKNVTHIYDSAHFRTNQRVKCDATFSTIYNIETEFSTANVVGDGSGSVQSYGKDKRTIFVKKDTEQMNPYIQNYLNFSSELFDKKHTDMYKFITENRSVIDDVLGFNRKIFFRSFQGDKKHAFIMKFNLNLVLDKSQANGITLMVKDLKELNQK